MNKPRSLKTIVNSIITIMLAILMMIQIVYFAYFSSLMNEQKQGYADDLASQIASVISDKVESINIILDRLSNDFKVQEYMQNRAAKVDIVDLVWLMRGFSAENLGVAIIGTDGKYLFQNSLSDTEINIISQISAENVMDDEPYVTFFKTDEKGYQDICLLSVKKLYVPSRKNVELEYLGNVVVVNKVNVVKLISGIENSGNMEIKLQNTDNDGEIDFYTPNHSFDNSEWLELKKKINDCNWQLLVKLCYNKAESTYYPVIRCLLVEAAVILLLVLAIQRLLRLFVTKPAGYMAKFAANYIYGKKKERLCIKQNEELYVISQAINEMLDSNEELARKIVRTQQRMYEQELNEKEAVLYALQNQINPHFLYNTLDCIRSIACVNDMEDIVDISVALSKIMRYTLICESETFVYQELEALEYYLKIQSVRYPDMFDIKFYIEDDVWDMKMLRMTLQPIVENAFKHAFSFPNKRGFLEITGKAENGSLILTVSDNGCGMTPDTYKALNEKLQKREWSQNSRIGICNIHRRLVLYYGENYGIEIKSKCGQGTKIILRFPAFG